MSAKESRSDSGSEQRRYEEQRRAEEDRADELRKRTDCENTSRSRSCRLLRRKRCVGLETCARMYVDVHCGCGEGGGDKLAGKTSMPCLSRPHSHSHTHAHTLALHFCLLVALCSGAVCRRICDISVRC